MATNDELLYEIRQSHKKISDRLKRVEAKLDGFILLVEETEPMDDEIEGMSVN